MRYSFNDMSIINQNGRVFMPIPFNVWEVCEKKGMLNAKVTINEYSFECRLIPKGEGNYYIPLNKVVQEGIGQPKEYRVEFEFIEKLSRINNNSLYSIDNPIRKIDSIKALAQPKNRMCGQTCVAMLAGVTVEEVVEVMHAKSGEGSMSKVIETLDYYGIGHGQKLVYLNGKNIELPKLCILTVKEGEGSHYVVYYDNKYYDPSYGALDSCDKYKKICYLEIFQ